MKQSDFLRTNKLFPGSDLVRRFTFKAVYVWDTCALLAKVDHHLAMGFDDSRDSCAHLYDCFECLSPYKVAA